MIRRPTRQERCTATLTLVIGLLAACVASSYAAASSAAAKPKPKTSAKAFCADAKNLAALDTKTLKDISSSVNVTSPGYVSKQFGATLAVLHPMYVHAPAAILGTAKQYVNAYIDYGRRVAEVHWNLQPTDPGQQKIVTDATLTYAPVATADLPKLDAFVKKTCGFALNLVTAPPR